MRIWLALILAPSIALGTQSVMYALVTPQCSAQTRIAIHAVAAVALLLCVIFTLLARSAGAPVRFGADHDSAEPPVTRHFLAIVAAAVGLLSALIIFGMWIGAWVLSPCFS
jgi:heme A synthase